MRGQQQGVFNLSDPLEAEAQKLLNVLNEHTHDTYTVGYEDEYICLYCDGRMLTSGCTEVPDRLKVLIRELGLMYEVMDD